MTARHHGDGGPERTFPALPPSPGRALARTWWGRAWLKALEDSALDAEQLRHGRRYARGGAVGAVSVRPGRITAVVRDRDRTPYRADVLLRELTAGEWERLLDTVADRAGHIAALLDRDMPPHLVEDAAAADVELLPGIGDLEADCDCGAWDHCGHTAALCYQVARLLDEDPFVLLLMRGREERETLAALQARNSAGAATAPQERHDAAREARRDRVPAREAFAAGAALPPLPAPPPAVTEPGPGPVLAGDTELDVYALEFLAADAAARACRILADALLPGHARAPVPAPLTVAQDAARLAAARPAERVAARLAAGSGRDRTGLALAVAAWECGGPGALTVLEEAWTPDADALARARAQLAAAWADDDAPPCLRAERNRWTAVGTDAQLRLGRDGRWWPYRRERGRWRPVGPAAHDPAPALATALGGG